MSLICPPGPCLGITILHILSLTGDFIALVKPEGIFEGPICPVIMDHQPKGNTWSQDPNRPLRLGFHLKENIFIFLSCPSPWQFQIHGVSFKKHLFALQPEFVANYFYTVGNNIKLALLPGTLDGHIWVS